MSMVRVEVFVEYQDVVQVDKYMSLMYLDVEYVIHHRLKGSGGVRHSEEHDQGFK